LNTAYTDDRTNEHDTTIALGSVNNEYQIDILVMTLNNSSGGNEISATYFADGHF